MPYIALQLVGIQVVIAGLGLGKGDFPLIVAFVILALYTYKSGLRAPAMIAFVKDVLIYVTVVAAVLVIPVELGGYGPVFEAADKVFAAKGGPSGLLLKPGQMLPFASLALGSAMALFMYPHSVTGILSSSSARTIRWNAILLPAYTVLLGLIALLGYMAIADNVKVANPNEAVPALFLKIFPNGSSGSALRPSLSVRSCPQQSCPSELQNYLLEIFGNRFSGLKSARRKRPPLPK